MYAEKAQLTGSLRSQISLLAVRSNARLLISRMESYVGQGAAEAARRGQQAAAAERCLLRLCHFYRTDQCLLFVTPPPRTYTKLIPLDLIGLSKKSTII